MNFIFKKLGKRTIHHSSAYYFTYLTMTTPFLSMCHIYIYIQVHTHHPHGLSQNVSFMPIMCHYYIVFPYFEKYMSALRSQTVVLLIHSPSKYQRWGSSSNPTPCSESVTLKVGPVEHVIYVILSHLLAQFQLQPPRWVYGTHITISAFYVSPTKNIWSHTQYSNYLC